MSVHKKSLLERISNIDPRVIRVIMGLSVLIPILIPLGIPIVVESRVKSLYDTIESLPEDSVVIVNYAMGTATWGEIGLASIPILKHLWSRPLKLVFATFFVESIPIVTRVLALTESHMTEKVYGVDYVVLPFVAGMAPTIAAFADNPSGIYTNDEYGTPVEDLQLMRELSDANDFELIITMDHTGTEAAWLGQVTTRYDTLLATITLALEEINHLPYYQSGQLVSLVVGGKGGAQYEILIGEPGKNIQTMDATSSAYLTFVILIIISNISYWGASRINKRRS